MDKHIKEGVKRFNSIDKKETIRIISHLDTDGICSAAILTKAMIRERRKFSVTFINYPSKGFILSLTNEPSKHYMFLDLGTSHLKEIKKFLKEKDVYILDHHSTRIKKPDDEIVHINPNMFGIEGSKEISGAGVAYLFSKAMNPKNADLAYLGILGAIGDSQENNGFLGKNNEILKDALDSKKISIEKCSYTWIRRRW